MLNGLEWIVLTVTVLGVFVVGTLVLSLAFTAGLPLQLAMECPERDGLPNGGLSGEGSPRRGRI